MRILLLISLRNLLRQKRRNLLLGAAIAIGMAMLVIANAFSHGISDILFNRLLSYMSGHVTVAFTQNGNPMRPVFHDGERMMGMVRKAVPGYSSAEEGIGVFARAVGNGRSDNVIIVGMDTRVQGSRKQLEDLRSDFQMQEGKYEDINRTDIENPVLVANSKAAYMMVKVGDYLSVRFQDIYGRSQAARLTVAGIFRPANVFMAAPVFVDVRRLKVLAGYGPHDIGSIHISLPDPKQDAVKSAEALYRVLRPPLAVAYGRMKAVDHPAVAGSRNRPASRLAPSKPVVSATVLGFRVDTASIHGLKKILSPHFPGGRDSLVKTDVLASAGLADALGLKPGDRCLLRYRSKFDTGEVSAEFKVSAILAPSPLVPANVLLVNDKDFYGFFYDHWPVPPPADSGAFLPDSNQGLSAYLCREWILLDRTRTTEEVQKKYRGIARMKSRATTVDAQTMYENASMIIKLEYALNLITLVAVLILFFIIQVGVVNTLRMTIRERTREIGTLRAIGMQKWDVRNIFLLETFFLSLFACLAGLVLAFAAMFLLRQFSFRQEGNPLGILLVDGHLHFLPSLIGTALYLLLILAIASVTAWFPARRAAKLPAAEALRHFG